MYFSPLATIDSSDAESHPIFAQGVAVAMLLTTFATAASPIQYQRYVAEKSIYYGDIASGNVASSNMPSLISVDFNLSQYFSADKPLAPENLSIRPTFNNIERLPEIIRKHHSEYEQVSEKILSNAKYVVLVLSQTISRENMSWISPHVTTDGEGLLVLEWWNDERKLTLFVGEKSTEFLKVWGPDIRTQMEDGSVSTSSHMANLWRWLEGFNA